MKSEGQRVPLYPIISGPATNPVDEKPWLRRDRSRDFSHLDLETVVVRVHFQLHVENQPARAMFLHDVFLPGAK